MDNPFLLTLFFLLTTSLLGIILKGRSTDRCLRDLRGFPVCVALVDRKEIWGRLRVANSGLELSYERPHPEDGYNETSALLFGNEFDKIWHVARHAGELDEMDEQDRTVYLEKMSHPSVARRLGRRLRNLVSSLKDAVLQIVGMTVQQAKKIGPGSTVLTTQDKYITQMGHQMVSSTLYEYDVLLEGLLGKRVVVERTREGQRQEIVGVLANYTSSFLEILDCGLIEEFVLREGSPLLHRFRRFLVVSADRKGFYLRRLGGPEVEVKSWIQEGEEHPVVNPEEMEASADGGYRLDVGDRFEIPGWSEGVRIKLRLKRRTDLVMPRASAIVRHAAT